MTIFFQTIGSRQDYKKWLLLIDWIINEEKFIEWPQQKVSLLTKQIKQIEEIKLAGITNAKNGKGFPNRQPRKTKIVISGKHGAKELIKHIRNSIAHGNAEFKTCNTVKYILLKDYYTDSRGNHKKGDYSAYIFIPENVLFKIQDIYDTVK